LAKALGQLGRWDEAVDWYRQGLVFVESGEVVFALGQALAQLQRWDEAIAEYQGAIALGFADAEVRHHLGYAFSQLGRYEEAVVELRQVVEVNPKSAQVRHQLGYALMQLGRLREAAVELRKATKLHPGSAVVWQQLGDVLRELGEKEEAEEAYRQALELKSRTSGYASELSRALPQMRRVTQNFGANEQGKKDSILKNRNERSTYLNVLFVLYGNIDSNGGYHVQLHANRLLDQGVDCLFAVPDSSDNTDVLRQSLHNLSNPVPILTFSALSIPGYGLPFANGHGPDVIHAWTPREIVRKCVERLLKQYSCPLVIHLEDNEEYLTEAKVGIPFAELAKLPETELDKIIPGERYHPIKGKAFLQQAQGLTMIIETLKGFNTTNVPELLLAPPVDESLFYPRPINQNLRRSLSIPEDHVVLAYTGNVHSGNRDEVRELYQAVEILNQQGCPTVLLRTGLNREEMGVESWGRSYEKYLGWVEREQVPEILAAADVLVQPGVPGVFNDQRVPSKLLEYFAMGRPVVLPKTNLGLRVKHGQQGYVLERSDAQGIAGAVQRIKADQELARWLSDGAVEFYLSQLREGVVAIELDDYYRCLVDENVQNLPKKILFYYAGATNTSQPFAGSNSAMVTLATALASAKNTISIDITGERIKYSERYQGVSFLPLPPERQRSTFLSQYEVVVFATHLEAFSTFPKPPGQAWILHQHCWGLGQVEISRFNDFDIVLCLSEIHREVTLSSVAYPEKIQVLPNIVDYELFKPQLVKRKKRSIMFAGAIVEHKGVHVLLDALPIVHRVFPDVEVHIYGSAAMWHDSDSYEKIIRSRQISGVYFHGTVSREEMPKIYVQHSIVCVPSEIESFGLVAVEAQACGCIPIVHHSGGVAATLINNKTGFLYAPNTPQELANTVIKVLSVEEDSHIRYNAVEFIRAKFDKNKIVEHFVEILSHTVAKYKYRTTVSHQNILHLIENEPREECVKQQENSALIPPEIKNDGFYVAIQALARTKNIKTVLEIGSSSGQGSTEAFVTGMRENPHKPIIFCMEVSRARFLALQNSYKDDNFVKCYNVSSVSIADFPDESEVVSFYKHIQTNLNQYPLEQILGWLRQDITNLKKTGVPVNGIETIKRENNINFFDVVLIDGSEFTGVAELQQVYGAKYILLDDINAFKNYKNHQTLLVDCNYELIEENLTTRNGYSLFKRVAESKNIQRQPRKVLFTVACGNVKDKFEHQTKSRIKEYAEYYDWEYQAITEYKDIKRSDDWIKIDYTIKLFHQLRKGDLVAYISPDVAVVNGDCELTTTKSVAFAKDSSNYINSGVWVAKVNEFSSYFFESVWNRTDSDSHPWQENQAIIDVLEQFSSQQRERYIEILSSSMNVTIVPGDYPKYDQYISNPCQRIRFRHFAGGQPWLDRYFQQPVLFTSPQPQPLTIHFFTIVLNGKPWIKYHAEVFQKLPFKWHWHIVEGVAELKHDTAWSLQFGGRVTEQLHRNGRSNDGTKEYLDELKQRYPNNVTIYRKPEGVFWDGKREMVNAPMVNINEECLLWQIDVDELWTFDQICTARQMFMDNPDKTAAWYWCWYFVGEDLVISTRHCYTQNPHQEWLRTWRFKPGMEWKTHEPPGLFEPLPNGKWRDVGAVNPFKHGETEKHGLIFQHFAYVSVDQLRFKEIYYGYKNAVSQWQKLQSQKQFPLLLREYLSWVNDETRIKTAESMGVLPIARRQLDGNWIFVQRPKQAVESKKNLPIVVIDAVFFQFNNTGIARVWRSLLEEWAATDFAKHILVLDRNNSAPQIPGIKYRAVPAYDYNKTDVDRKLLQQICDEEQADLFISTYYTTPLSTPSVFMGYDMIPEIIAQELDNPMWIEKNYAICHASAYITISENTARDLVKFYPYISRDLVTPAHCGVESKFSPASSNQIENFKSKHGISKPYFVLVGERMGWYGYKNTILFFKAFTQLANKFDLEIVCIGGKSILEPDLSVYVSGSTVHLVRLTDDELRAAYSGALALVYPSKYEGFGLPVLEAISCGCPVITCPNASIPEVGGQAVVYVNEDDVSGLVNALTQVQDLQFRKSLIDAGLEQAKKFSWSKMANIVKNTFTKIAIDLDLIQPTFRVSAIISTYNSEKFIRGCLEDLVDQTLYKKGEVEIIVVDSNSQENEGNIVSEFQAKYPNIVYERTPERETLYAAWNRAIKMSRGTYITNANTDDRHRPDAFEIMANYLDAHPDVSVVYSDQLIGQVPNETWATTKANRRFNWPPYSYEEMERRSIVGPQPMWKKSLHDRWGYFKPEFISAGDYEFWLRIGKMEKIAFIPQILGIYYWNPESLSLKADTVGTEETHRIWHEYGIFERGIIPAQDDITLAVSWLELNALPYRKANNSSLKIIIPKRDFPEELANAVKSVLLKNYHNVELIIIDELDAKNSRFLESFSISNLA
jgi:glycosyltransferase involved in cell wall biosynthesis/Flp pilus assembly protein TadD/GT2 family glycosyltransferase